LIALRLQGGIQFQKVVVPLLDRLIFLVVASRCFDLEEDSAFSLTAACDFNLQQRVDVILNLFFVGFDHLIIKLIIKNRDNKLKSNHERNHQETIQKETECSRQQLDVIDFIR